jgi:ribulose-phosphate 3-epimerase
MSVNPGYGGQSFIPLALAKIATLRELIEKNNLGSCVAIEVDGGIKIDNFAAAVHAGASVLVSGSGIFETKDYKKTMDAMRARAAGSQA